MKRSPEFSDVTVMPVSSRSRRNVHFSLRCLPKKSSALCVFAGSVVPSLFLKQRFPNWWVASRFVVGRKTFLKCDFFNCIKIKNHKKWESEKAKQN
jgi:hypothetical protein